MADGRREALAAWEEAAGALMWDQPWSAAYVDDRPGGSWFPGGTLNASVNCLDRHLPARAGQVAIHWEGETGDRRTITYGALHTEVVSFTEALRGLGVEPGDRVALHLGWLPETVVAMLACARLGAVHGVLPASLPADALADRLSGLSPKVLVTQDGALRHGLIVPSKSRADEALAAAGGVEATVVVRRVGVDVAWYEGDRWYHDLVAAPRPGTRKAPAAAAGEAAPVAADHPLLIVPLAHRRGQPTWIVHRTGGYLVAAATTHARALTTGPDDVFWCAAEIAWIGGQSHGVYGPLACGATTVMSEGTLDVPTRSRTWDIIERYGVNALVTTPSVVRNLRQWVDTPPAHADLSSLRLIVTLGERIDPETRNWLDFEVGGGRALIANAWGQTELAGLVAVTAAPTGTAAPVPDPGLEVFDAGGRPVVAGGTGELVLLHPWPGAFLDAEGSPAPADSWWSPYPGAYATGDEARRGADGRLTVLGRRDPVVSISGQQVSLTEVAQILEEHPLLEAVDVIAVPDERRGQALCACMVLDPKAEPGEGLAREVRNYVHDALGGLARPHTVAFVEAFPPGLAPEVRRRALRLLCTANPAEWFTVTAAQLAAAATATE
ncbi:MAG TPA: AMP-binding protein [Acidimicrobiia bacterium]|jgi:acetyl-CoA synthetase|nr:AMP-binding protein [Acidimicrobiia bacterium]